MNNWTRKWCRFYGGKLFALLLVCAGIMVWTLARFLHLNHQRSLMGALAGVSLVALGLIVGLVAALAPGVDQVNQESAALKGEAEKRARSR